MRTTYQFIKFASLGLFRFGIRSYLWILNILSLN